MDKINWEPAVMMAMAQTVDLFIFSLEQGPLGLSNQTEGQ